ncbi:MAG TPA: ABC transporter permease [Gemmatimonadaceae bacterium]|nr:ABC transporter permease [Gemmatimonadaceae bacterium]
MRRLLARRLWHLGVVVALATTLSFFLIRLAPGDPFLALLENPRVTPQQVERLRAEYGLDRPLPEQYARYVTRIARGDLGDSFTYWKPVRTLIAERLPRTMLLMGLALTVSFLLGIAIGVIQAWRAGTATDRVLGAVAMFFYSLPDFWLALVVLYVFGYKLDLFPTSMIPAFHLGPVPWWQQLAETAVRLAMPVMTLALLTAALIARYQRAAMLDVSGRDFVRTARAKGASERRVLLRHILRNALLPIVTLLGLAFPALLAGSVFIERIFSYQGVGYLTVEAIRSSDPELVASLVLLMAVLVSIGNLLADLLYAVVDPRMRARA